MTTNDKIIRTFLRIVLEKELEQYKTEKKLPAEIFEEFGVSHGTARIDIAVINGIMHGYEIKSDRDTLIRLSDQMDIYNSVFDQITLVVGKSHLYDAINIVPDWWGIMIAKFDAEESIVLQYIREPKDNKEQDSVEIARLLWREEALEILEKTGEARGFRSKPRDVIYEKLSTIFDQQNLGKEVREALFSRRDWRSDVLPVLNGG
ncbi:sce7726 family protein [Patescibacteria group bacterium]|nr:sce7726 family protein [Patescibacteria group bacterium]